MSIKPRPAKPPMRLLTLAALRNLPRPDWLIDDVLPVGALGFLVGKWKDFKTFVALDIGMAVAAGQHWQGRDTRQGAVVYIMAEGSGGIGPRIEAQRRSRKIDDARPFFAVPERVKLADSGARKRLVGALRAAGIEPVLIIVDTLARTFSGNENAAQDMNAYVEGADALKAEFGCAVLIIHHFGNDNSRGARGSTALDGAYDTMIEVSSSKHDTPEEGWKNGDVVGTAFLKCAGQKDAEPFRMIGLDMVRVDWGEDNSLVPREPDPSTLARRFKAQQTTSEAKALEVLEGFGEAGARAKEWQEACKPMMSSATFYTARTALCDNERVSHGDDKRYRVNSNHSKSTPTGVNGAAGQLLHSTPKPYRVGVLE